MILLLRVPSSGDRVGAIDPPISQGLIAAAAIARGVDARLLDLTYAGQTGVDDLTSALGDTGLRVVGMSTYQSNIERCLAIARLVKTLRPDVKVLLGGPQATHMPAAGLTAMADVDGLCRGAGEGVLVDYASAIDTPQRSFRGFLHRVGDCIADGGIPSPPSPDDIVSPLLTGLWPAARYPFAVTFASRGCPYACAYCYTPASSGRRMLYMPLHSVEQEVAVLSAASVPHLFFADPIFVVDPDRTRALLSRLGRIRGQLTFSCELRMEHASNAVLGDMAAAGFVRVAFGLETANERLLAGVRRPTSLAQFRETVMRALAHGIAVEVFYMFGLPGETRDDVLRTFDFIASLHPVVDALSEPQQVQLYFGTELLADHAAYGIELLGDRPPYLSPGREYRTATLGPDDFARLDEEWSTRSASRAVAAPMGVKCP